MEVGGGSDTYPRLFRKIPVKGLVFLEQDTIRLFSKSFVSYSMFMVIVSILNFLSD